MNSFMQRHRLKVTFWVLTFAAWLLLLVVATASAHNSVECVLVYGDTPAGYIVLDTFDPNEDTGRVFCATGESYNYDR